MVINVFSVLYKLTQPLTRGTSVAEMDGRDVGIDITRTILNLRIRSAGRRGRNGHRLRGSASINHAETRSYRVKYFFELRVEIVLDVRDSAVVIGRQ